MTEQEDEFLAMVRSNSSSESPCEFCGQPGVRLAQPAPVPSTATDAERLAAGHLPETTGACADHYEIVRLRLKSANRPSLLDRA